MRTTDKLYHVICIQCTKIILHFCNAQKQRQNIVRNAPLKFKDIKGVIRGRKSKKYRQCHGQKKKDKREYNDMQNTTQNTKDRATRTPLKTGVNSCVPEG